MATGKHESIGTTNHDASSYKEPLLPPLPVITFTPSRSNTSCLDRPENDVRDKKDMHGMAEEFIRRLMSNTRMDAKGRKILSIEGNNFTVNSEVSAEVLPDITRVTFS